MRGINNDLTGQWVQPTVYRSSST